MTTTANETKTVAEYESNGARYTGDAKCGTDIVRVGDGRKPGMHGKLAATSDGWTDTSILRIPAK